MYNKSRKRRKKIGKENQKLKRESEQIDQKISKPDEATIKSSAENQELEKAKEYYLSKNIEIEQLIKQVMNGTSGPPKDPRMSDPAAAGLGTSGMSQSIMGQSPEQIESLLRFLIYLVLHKEKMDPEEYNRGTESRES